MLGSIPSGYLVGKLCHSDLRREGSNNIGATNAMRVLGKKWGYIVFSADFFKGVFAVELALTFSKDEWLELTAAVLAIIGHNFPLWLSFKGGRGIATTAGVSLSIFPWPVSIIALIVWGCIFFVTRYVSLASLIAVITLPLTCWILLYFDKIGLKFAWVSLGICALAICRHQSNILRLMSGTEPQFKEKKD